MHGRSLWLRVAYLDMDEQTVPAQLRGLRLLLGRHNKPISGRAFAELTRMSPATLRSAESGVRPLSPEDRRRIAYWIGAQWAEKEQRWVYVHDHRIPFTRELFELYSAVQFFHPHARDVETHMAALALIYLLHALPRDSYRYSLFRLHDRLLELAAEFAPEVVPTLENLRPALRAYHDNKTKKLVFSGIVHPNCEKVAGSEILGPKREDGILNFHELRLAQAKPSKTQINKHG